MPYAQHAPSRLWQVLQNGVLTATYLYDANGNRLSKTTTSGAESGAYDAQDRLLTYGKRSYTYTANGDLLTKTDTSNGQVTTYSYDAKGNLRHVGLPDGRLIDYVIDSENRRVAKKINGVVVRKWIYEDQLRPVAEFDGSGTLLARYLDGVTVKGSTSYRVVADNIGTPRLLVNSATGAIAQRQDLDEWGQVTADSSAGFQAFGFAGGIYDSDTGLVRFGARDYDPVIGRWTAKDPIRFEGGSTNIYEYVHSQPVGNRDASGLYGTNDCSYYDQRCQESGGDYYCKQAPDWCNTFPKYPDPDPKHGDDFEGWSRCTRQCLQDCDHAENQDQNACPKEPDPRKGPWDPRSTSFDCHAHCYTYCSRMALPGPLPPPYL